MVILPTFALINYECIVRYHIRSPATAGYNGCLGQTPCLEDRAVDHGIQNAFAVGVLRGGLKGTRSSNTKELSGPSTGFLG